MTLSYPKIVAVGMVIPITMLMVTETKPLTRFFAGITLLLGLVYFINITEELEEESPQLNKNNGRKKKK